MKVDWVDRLERRLKKSRNYWDMVFVNWEVEPEDNSVQELKLKDNFGMNSTNLECRVVFVEG